VIGSTGPDLLIDRVSQHVSALLRIPTSQLLGRSLIHLVSSRSVPPLLFGIAEAARLGRVVTLHLDLQRGDGTLVPVDMVLSPLHPPASTAFSVIPVARRPLSGPGRVEGTKPSAGPAEQLARSSAPRPADGDIPSFMPLTRLTSREADIVSRLVTGDRVPAIARDLFLTQSTVRNHLSSVFKKLQVHGQQELVDLLRRGGASGREQG
jgi:DNA-binding CsgD family transcriptional regulator